MLGYASPSRPAERAGSPKVLGLILIGHIAVVGIALTTKMAIDPGGLPVPIDIFNVPLKPPPPPPPKPTDPVEPRQTVEPRTETIVIPPPPRPLPNPLPGPTLDSGTTTPNSGPTIGSGDVDLPLQPPPRPLVMPVRKAARFITPPDSIRPPYPVSKIRSEEEASLRLRLTIDARGRVTAVEPAAAADPAFLEAARRHIVRAWRYAPATLDGEAVESTTVITLRFQLDDA